MANLVKLGIPKAAPPPNPHNTEQGGNTMSTTDSIEKDIPPALNGQCPSWLLEDVTQDQVINSGQVAKASSGLHDLRNVTEDLDLTFSNPDLIMAGRYIGRSCPAFI